MVFENKGRKTKTIDKLCKKGDKKTAFMEKQINIIIANENNEETKELVDGLTRENLTVVASATNGNELLSEINNHPETNVVVLDLLLSGKDGFSVIEELKLKNSKIKFVVTTALSSATFVQKAMALGVEYYMLKSIDTNCLCDRIMDIFEPKQPASIEEEPKQIDSKTRELEEKITNIFITVGIPAHIKGYQFLREAIKMAIKKPDIINSITKELYPSIASHFDTSASKVERAIRHAIEVAWNRGKIENINNVFGIRVYSNNEKPTNGEFIALVADKMLLEG